MTRTTKVLAAIGLGLILLFVGPVIYHMGHRVGLYAACLGSGYDCWDVSGTAVMHGGKLPRGRR